MLDTALSSAASAPAIRQFIAVRIELDLHTIDLMDGSAAITFPVDGTPVTFTGSDPKFGTLAAIGSVSEQMATESPTLSISLYPPSASAIGEIANPSHQGAPVRVWWGILDEATGTPIGTPELLWSGRFDTAKPNLSAGSQVVEIETVSAFDRLFVAEEGARLNKVWHQSIWPNETGLDFNVKALQDVFWGLDAPVRSAVTYTPNAFGKAQQMIESRYN